MALKFTIILQSLTTANRRKNCESKYDRKLTESDVVTTRIRYRVNGDLVKLFVHFIYHQGNVNMFGLKAE